MKFFSKVDKAELAEEKRLDGERLAAIVKRMHGRDPSKVNNPGRREMAKLCAGKRIEDGWDRIPRRDRRHPSQQPALASKARGKRAAKQLLTALQKRDAAEAKRRATIVAYESGSSLPKFKESA